MFPLDRNHPSIYIGKILKKVRKGVLFLGELQVTDR